MKKVIVSFLIIIILFCNLSVNVYASNFEDSTAELTPYEYYQLKTNNFLLYLMESAGVILNPAKYGEGLLKDRFVEYMADKHLIENVDSMEDYINSHMNITGDTIQVDDELMDAVYSFSLEIIEEETGWFVHTTAECNEITKYYVDNFETSTQYVALRDYINSNTDKVFLIPRFSSTAVHMYDENGSLTGEIIEGIYFYMFDISDFDFVASKSTYENYNINAYDKNWESVGFSRYVMDLGGTVRCAYTYESQLRSSLTGIHPYGSQDNNKYYAYKHEGYTSSMTIEGFPVWAIDLNFWITASGENMRMYKSLSDLKQYSVGERPYYITDKFQDYDINGDNSCIVTESDLSNGSVYGDVYNYIINNYDNPDGLTEDELRDILNDYFGEGSGGSGSGSGSEGSGSGSSGGGLSGFLSGLGSLGDAILGILGKLIEYIGKAIDLIVNGLTDIIDKIPKGVTDFMSAMFPFMPEEFFTALTLAMVLGVVCIVIKIFK